MQKPEFNKRWDGETFLGLDAQKLAALPPDLRAEIIEAVSEAQEVSKSNDRSREAALTSRIVRLTERIRHHNGVAWAEKAFANSMRRTSGDHAVIRKFAERAGVKA